MRIPATKSALIGEGEEKIKFIQKRYWHGYLTEGERYAQSVDVWSQIKKVVEKDMKEEFSFKNPIFQMVDSGSRGNWGNITQLCGMVGLVASPTGKTIELPIKSNFSEGLSTLEYFISTHGGRKGKADTALKTAQSGYLTRRLVDASQNILIREADCGTKEFQTVYRATVQTDFNESFEQKVYGKVLANDVVADGETLATKGTMITRPLIETFESRAVESVDIYSILTCETENGVCQKCYGLDLGHNEPSTLGTPVGIVAAQSIGEPGTQLTMRTFHSGGVAKEGGDITQGLTRVEELFEARAPKYQAIIADVDATVTEIRYEGQDVHITIRAHEQQQREYYLPDDSFSATVKKGDHIREKAVLAKSSQTKSRLTATHEGIVEKISGGVIVIKDAVPEEFTYTTNAGRTLLKSEGEVVEQGEKITEGHINLQELMELS